MKKLTILFTLTLLTHTSTAQNSSKLSFGISGVIQSTKMSDYNSTLNFYSLIDGANFDEINHTIGYQGFVTYNLQKFAGASISITYNNFATSRTSNFKVPITTVDDPDNSQGNTIDTDAEFTTTLNSYTIAPAYQFNIGNIHSLIIAAGISYNVATVEHVFNYSNPSNPNISFPPVQKVNWSGEDMGFIGTATFEVWRDKRFTPQISIGYRTAKIDRMYTDSGPRGYNPAITQDYSGMFGNIGIRYNLL